MVKLGSEIKKEDIKLFKEYYYKGISTIQHNGVYRAVIWNEYPHFYDAEITFETKPGFERDEGQVSIPYRTSILKNSYGIDEHLYEIKE